MNKREKTIYICNVSEDVWPFIEMMGGDRVRAAEVDENAGLADRDLFSVANESEVLFVSPRSIDEEFMIYFKGLFPRLKLEVVVPKTHTGKVCDDAMADEEAVASMVQFARGTAKVAVKAYSTSEQFLNLVSLLKRRGLPVYTPESPEEESAWTVNFLGSKSGIRQLLQKTATIKPDFKMADGVVCSGVFDASAIAANKYIKEKGVVIKTNKGHSGAGVLVFRPGDLPDDFVRCERSIRDMLEKDEYWSRFPIVVESYVRVNYALGGGFPNAEFKIAKNGKVDLLYWCGMRVTKEGVFRGVEINEGVINDKVEAKMIDAGFFLGEKYAEMGYRGYFDIDYISAKNGEIIVTESNVRRTGGTHVYNSARQLVGEDFMDSYYVLSDNAYQLPVKRRPRFANLFKKLKPLMFDKKSKEGLVIVSANLLAIGKLAYMIFGKSKKQALAIEVKMERLLQDL